MDTPANTAPSGGLTPHIAIPDKRGSEAIDFYKKAFGATEVIRVPAQDGVRFMHAHVHINGASLMMHDDFPEYTGSAMSAPTGHDAAPARRRHRRLVQPGDRGGRLVDARTA